MKRVSFTDMLYEERRARREALSQEERAKVEANFVDVELRGITRHPLTGRPVIGFNTDNGPVRFHVSWDDAYNIISGGFEFWFYATLTNVQSPISSGNPQSAGFQTDGQSVEPPAKSSSACCADEYFPPRKVSSKYGDHRPPIERIVNVPRLLSNFQYPSMRFSTGWFATPMVKAAGRTFKSVRSCISRSVRG